MTIRQLLIGFSIVSAAMTTTGCAFSSLEEDLEKMEGVTHSFTGTVVTEGLLSNALVIVASHDSQGESVAAFNLMFGDGSFEMRLSPTPTYFFGFNDLNKDLRFQRDEPYG